MSTHNQVKDSLDANPEAILFHQVRAGCRVSLNGLMVKHEGLVQAVVRDQCLFGPALNIHTLFLTFF